MGLKRNHRQSSRSSTASSPEKSNRHSLPVAETGQRARLFWNGAFLLAAALGLNWFFWSTLWKGGGLIGGDTYSYYFPQKVAYADALDEGRLPLWNSLVSLGYPQLAESQTGALYPPNLVLYGLFDVNTAYNASHLLHYIAAYVFTWLLARRFGLFSTGAHLAALSFVYGWFPVRACLEWAIFGGAYFPLIIWCVESYLQSARLRWLVTAAIALGMFLLTGHFNLAFITLLLSALLIGSRLTWATTGLAPQIQSARFKAAARLAFSVILGFALAAPQLLPSAELKSLSQREEGQFRQAYGHIPAWYLTQPFWPSLWYSPDIDVDRTLPESNRIEAHLYFGVIPFYLAIFAVCGAVWRFLGGAGPDRRLLVIAIAGALGIVLATGLPMPLLRHVPGFGYFAGPGRYGMLTALAVALIGGRMLDRLLASPFARGLWPAAAAIAFGITAWDLESVSRQMTYLTFVERAPVTLREQSTLREILSKESLPVRVLAPGPNLPTITGLNCVPEYLGIGPRQYYDSSTAIPRFTSDEETPERQAALVRWLQQAGVTHVLAEAPLDPAKWPVSNGQQLLDPFLNAAWGRGLQPHFLYQLENHRPRAFLQARPDGTGVSITRHHPEHIEIAVESETATTLTLLELAFPGWKVEVDGQPAVPAVVEEMYRGVEVPAGRHVVTWRYQPRSFLIGQVVFALAVAGLLAWIFMERRRPAGATHE